MYKKTTKRKFVSSSSDVSMKIMRNTMRCGESLQLRLHFNYRRLTKRLRGKEPLHRKILSNQASKRILSV